MIIIVILTFVAYKYVKNRSLEYERTQDIILKTNGGVPYNWKCEIQDDEIVKIKNEYTVNKASKNVTGGPVDVHYVIESKQIGNTNISCKYKSIVNDSVASTEEYIAIVDDKLRIHIYKK